MRSAGCIVVDPLFGDSGKGKIAAALAIACDVSAAVEIGSGPSAAHVILSADDQRVVTRLLPPCFQHSRAALFIAAPTMVDPKILLREVAIARSLGWHGDFAVDTTCPIIEVNGNIFEEEVRHLSKGIASLFTAGLNSDLARHCTDVRRAVRARLAQGERIIVVVQHGTLVTQHGQDEVIPCDGSTAPALELLGDDNLEVVAVVKSMPTRTLSGSLPNEIAWPKHLPQQVGIATGRTARISSGPDLEMLLHSCQRNRATSFALTFADFVDPACAGVTRWGHLPGIVKALVSLLERKLNIPAVLVSTGPRTESTVYLENSAKWK